MVTLTDTVYSFVYHGLLKIDPLNYTLTLILTSYGRNNEANQPTRNVESQLLV